MKLNYSPVRDNVEESVQVSTWDNVEASVKHPVWSSVSYYVYNSVWNLAYNSVLDFVEGETQ